VSIAKKIKYKSIFISLAALGFLLFFFIIAAQNLQILKESQHRIMFASESSVSLTGAEAFQTQKQNAAKGNRGLQYTLWGQSTTETITTEISKASNVPVIAVSGRTDLIFPGCKRLDYDILNKCLIGSETANRLFGGTDIIGLPVKYGSRTFEVAGVIPSVADAFVFETNSAADTNMNRTTILCDNSNNHSIILNKYSAISPESRYFNYETILWLLELFMLILPFLLCISIVRESYGQMIDCKTARLYDLIRFLIWLVVIIGSIATFVFFARAILDYPSALIPPQWSDFEFWRNTLRAQADAFLFMLRQPVLASDQLYFFAMVKATLFTLLSLIMLVIIKWQSASLRKKDC
jgi:hypothetical protein